HPATVPATEPAIGPAITLACPQHGPAGALRAAMRACVALSLAAAIAACASTKSADGPAASVNTAGTATATATATVTAADAKSGTAARPSAASTAPATASAGMRPSRGGTALFSDLSAPGKTTPKVRASAPAVAREGKVIEGSVNVYDFSPTEEFVPADPMSTSVAQVLADLGPDAVEWYQHVQTLSNPWFEGRTPGTDGIERAAQYCEFWLQKAGLEPAFASGAQANASNPWRQPFDLPGSARRVASSALSIGGAEVAGAKAMRNSGGGTAEMPIAFVGYGIAEGKDGYSSFGTDERLDGRIAVVMRGEPLTAEGKSRWGGEKFTSASSLAAKIRKLDALGAAGIVVVEPPGYAGKKADLLAMSADSLGGEVGVPVFFADASAIDALLKACDREGRGLDALRALADEGSTGPARAIPGKDDAPVTLKVSIDTGMTVTHNVGGILRGKGALADEWIVIGAHYDHVGFGKYGADPRNRGKLHPGADDNASGTSGMLVTARRMAQAYADAGDGANLRSVLFIAFSAEEMGLNGSRYYIKAPSIAADKVDVMLNMDMIGRMRGGNIVVGGVDSAKGFKDALVPFFKQSGLTVHADPSGRGPSDHAPFFGAGIPVLFFFSGVHDVYHQPGDQGYSIDPRGIPAVLDLVGKIAMWRASDPERLEYGSGPKQPAAAASDAQAAAPAAPASAGDRGYAPVRLGIQPGPTEDGESGLQVLGVTAGTSAADAGIKVGDILVSWNGASLDDSGVLAQKLREHKPGDVVKIAIVRDGKDMTIDVTLKASAAQRRPQND
ncbi:MAG: M28 family peptidase, partial [Planctomycetota bacterium]